MAFADLIATEHHFGAEKAFMEEVLDELVDEESATADDITSIFIDPARLELEGDLYNAWSIDRESESGQEAFEDRVALCPSHLKAALAYKQLELLYDRYDQGEQSLNRYRFLHYRAKYKEESRRFSSYGLSTGRASIRSVSIKL